IAVWDVHFSAPHYSQAVLVAVACRRHAVLRGIGRPENDHVPISFTGFPRESPRFLQPLIRLLAVPQNTMELHPFEQKSATYLTSLNGAVVVKVPQRLPHEPQTLFQCRPFCSHLS